MRVNERKRSGRRRRDRATSNEEEPGIRAMAPPGSRPLYSAKLTPPALPGGRNRYLGGLLTTSFTPPVRIKVGRIVVGDAFPAPPVGLDVIDLGVSGSGVVDIGYVLTGRRVGRLEVIRIVVGDFFPAPPVGVDRVDLPVVSVVARISYLGAAGSVVGLVVIRTVVVGDVFPAPSVGIDRIDVPVVSVLARIGYLGAAR